MKILYYLCCSACCLYAGTACSQVQSISNTFPIKYVNKTDTSLPLQSSFISAIPSIKLASVNFIAKTDSGRNFKSKDTSASCTGYPYTTEMAVANCASVSVCRDGHLQKLKCTSCKNNMTLGSDGRCKCNKTTYPYNMYDNPCAYAYDEDNKCQEISSDGLLKTYYVGCKCPTEWKECDKAGEVGFGGACVAGGKSYYSACTCKSPYSYLCNGSGQNYNEKPPVGNDYCTNTVTGRRYYKTCAEVCWVGFYKSAQDWWNQTCCSQ